MKHARILVVASAVAVLAGCGTDEGAEPRSASARPPALPSSRAIELRLFTAFRTALRSLSIATAAGGESGDIGQPVPIGLVDRVACRTPERCVVRWIDVRSDAHRTSYAVTPAARGCFDAEATPGLPGIYDYSTNSPSIHPLQQLTGGVEPC